MNNRPLPKPMMTKFTDAYILGDNALTIPLMLYTTNVHVYGDTVHTGKPLY